MVHKHILLVDERVAWTPSDEVHFAPLYDNVFFFKKVKENIWIILRHKNCSNAFYKIANKNTQTKTWYKVQAWHFYSELFTGGHFNSIH